MGRAFAMALCLLGPVSVSAQSSDAFMAELRRAAQAGDRAAVAALLQYPITVRIAGLRVPFKDAAAVLERYEDIFTPALLESIARGSQDITVEMVSGQWRITGITVPDESADAGTPAATPVDARRDAARTQQPSAALGARRVSIRVGPRPTQIPGVLARGATDVLLLYLPKGRLASVRLERVPAGAAVIRVVHATTGAPLGARAVADGRLVTGRPAESGEYRIEVRRMDDTDAAHLPYMLSLSLR